MPGQIGSDPIGGVPGAPYDSATTYNLVRDAIYAHLVNALTCPVYKFRRNATDWASFLAKFRDPQTGVIAVAWFSRISNDETVSKRDLGNYDIQFEILSTVKQEIWEIEFLYSFKDHDSAPSEDVFQNYVRAIEDEFRFTEHFNGLVFFAHPVRLVRAGLYMFGEVLCHKATFQLELWHRIIKP